MEKEKERRKLEVVLVVGLLTRISTAHLALDSSRRGAGGCACLWLMCVCLYVALKKRVMIRRVCETQESKRDSSTDSAGGGRSS